METRSAEACPCSSPRRLNDLWHEGARPRRLPTERVFENGLLGTANPSSPDEAMFDLATCVQNVRSRRSPDAFDQSTCHASLAYATMNAVPHFGAGLVIPGQVDASLPVERA